MGNIAINVIEDLRKLGEVLVPLVSKLGGISDVPWKSGMSKGWAKVEATVKHEKGGISSTKTHTYLLVSELPSL